MIKNDIKNNEYLMIKASLATGFNKIVNEIKSSVIFCDKHNFKEAYFGEHLADKYEKITSSLNIISAISLLTKLVLVRVP